MTSNSEFNKDDLQAFNFNKFRKKSLVLMFDFTYLSLNLFRIRNKKLIVSIVRENYNMDRHLVIRDENMVSCVTSINYRTFATGNYNSYLKVWDILSGDCLLYDKVDCGMILCMISLYENKIAAAGSNTTILIYTISREESDYSLYGHLGTITTLVKACDKVLVSGSCDKTVKVWSIQEKKCIKTFYNHISEIRTLSLFSQNEPFIPSKNEEVCFSLASVDTYRTLITNNFILRFRPTFFEEKFSASFKATSIVDSSVQQEVRCLEDPDPSKTKINFCQNAHDDLINGIAVLDENSLVTGCVKGVIKFWSITPLKLNYTIDQDNEKYDGVFEIFRLSQKEALVISKHLNLKIWNTTKYHCVYEMNYENFGGNFTCIEKIDNYQYLVANNLKNIYKINL